MLVLDSNTSTDGILRDLSDRRHEPEAALLYPSPCPSPTRGEGTVWHRSAQPAGRVRVFVRRCARALPIERRRQRRSCQAHLRMLGPAPVHTKARMRGNERRTWLGSRETWPTVSPAP